ncbi:hypothetical protein EYF80_045410 [Liparis tanakae]|uniref:Uncharacterized protein n=1 Tax=Liparis tanakae TaxID=230148 RepID=A0A4Z2FUC3_9TELE|nr:hypothetical protein EYF80_045410 [Liparis tanakae]
MARNLLSSASVVRRELMSPMAMLFKPGATLWNAADARGVALEDGGAQHARHQAALVVAVLQHGAEVQEAGHAAVHRAGHLVPAGGEEGGRDPDADADRLADGLQEALVLQDREGGGLAVQRVVGEAVPEALLQVPVVRGLQLQPRHLMREGAVLRPPPLLLLLGETGMEVTGGRRVEVLLGPDRAPVTVGRARHVMESGPLGESREDRVAPHLVVLRVVRPPEGVGGAVAPHLHAGARRRLELHGGVDAARALRPTRLGATVLEVGGRLLLHHHVPEAAERRRGGSVFRGRPPPALRLVAPPPLGGPAGAPGAHLVPLDGERARAPPLFWRRRDGVRPGEAQVQPRALDLLHLLRGRVGGVPLARSYLVLDVRVGAAVQLRLGVEVLQQVVGQHVLVLQRRARLVLHGQRLQGGVLRDAGRVRRVLQAALQVALRARPALQAEAARLRRGVRRQRRQRVEVVEAVEALHRRQAAHVAGLRPHRVAGPAVPVGRALAGVQDPPPVARVAVGVAVGVPVGAVAAAMRPDQRRQRVAAAAAALVHHGHARLQAHALHVGERRGRRAAGGRGVLGFQVVVLRRGQREHPPRPRHARHAHAAAAREHPSPRPASVVARLAGAAGGVGGDGVVRVGGAEVVEAAVVAARRHAVVLGALAGAPAGEAGRDAGGAPAAAQVRRAGGAAATVAPVAEQTEHRQLRAAQLAVSGRLRSGHAPLPARVGSWGRRKKKRKRKKRGVNTVLGL